MVGCAGTALPSPLTPVPDERQRRFEAAYAAHHGPILGYLLRRTDNPDDAADALAEVFLTAWRRLGKAAPSGAPQAREQV
jgi:DNA-directed RNA polymerase specialized sigma24 family protein